MLLALRKRNPPAGGGPRAGAANLPINPAAPVVVVGPASRGGAAGQTADSGKNSSVAAGRLPAATLRIRSGGFLLALQVIPRRPALPPRREPYTAPAPGPLILFAQGVDLGAIGAASLQAQMQAAGINAGAIGAEALVVDFTDQGVNAGSMGAPSLQVRLSVVGLASGALGGEALQARLTDAGVSAGAFGAPALQARFSVAGLSSGAIGSAALRAGMSVIGVALGAIGTDVLAVDLGASGVSVGALGLSRLSARLAVGGVSQSAIGLATLVLPVATPGASITAGPALSLISAVLRSVAANVLTPAVVGVSAATPATFGLLQSVNVAGRGPAMPFINTDAKLRARFATADDSPVLFDPAALQVEVHHPPRGDTGFTGTIYYYQAIVGPLGTKDVYRRAGDLVTGLAVSGGEGIVRDATGLYYLAEYLDVGGDWTWQWTTTTAPLRAYAKGKFTVDVR